MLERQLASLSSGIVADPTDRDVAGPHPLHHVAIGGRIVLAGMKGFKAVPDFVSDLVVVKEARIMGAFGVTSRAYEAAIRLIESGRVPVEKMHPHDFALEEAERAIQILAGELPDEQSIHSCLVRAHRMAGVYVATPHACCLRMPVAMW